MDNLIWIGVWCFIWAHIVQIAQMTGLAVICLIFALMCFMHLACLYDKVKEECDLERLLDTPQKRRDELIEGLTTFDFPEDEPLTRICPECGALYPSFKVICNYDKSILQPRKRITEPLPTLQITDAKLNMLIQDINETEQQFESELEKVRDELEDRAYEYGNKRRPYTFTDQEALCIYNLYTRVRMQSHEEYRAS